MKHLKRFLALALLFCWKMSFAQWVPQPLATNLSATHLEFLDDDIGYALMHQVNTSAPFLQKTTDGGATWTNLNFPAHPEFQAIHFYADSQGVAVFRNMGIPSPNPTKVYATTDDGATWQEITPDSTGTGMGTATIDFLDRNTGWFATDQYIYKTTDGGLTWLTQQLTGYPLDIDFIDAQHGTVGIWDGTFNYLGGMMSTVDGGLTWSTTWLTETGTQMDAVKQLTATTALANAHPYMPTNQTKFYWTTDNGASWDTILGPSGVGSYSVSGVDFRDTQHGVLALTSFTETLLFETTDRGASWAFQDSLPYFTLTGLVLTPSTGYIGGDLERIWKWDVANAVSPAVQAGPLTVYPNPVRSGGSLRWDGATQPTALSLTDLGGRTVWQSEVVSGQSMMDLPAVPAGLYLLHLQTATGTSGTAKVIVTD